MRRVLQPDWQIGSHRLALGVEALDAARGARIAHSFRIACESPVAGALAATFQRHRSNLQVWCAAGAVPSQVDLRLFDAEHLNYDPMFDRRRFVPRRLRVPLLPEAKWDERPYVERVRRPTLFAGAAYDLSEATTGLRGRVTRGGRPVRWARITARLTTGRRRVAGRAHGDDRGEFLLIVGPGASPHDQLPKMLALEVTVHAPPPPEPQAVDDPLWDLPLEMLPTPGAADEVSSGKALPANYATAMQRVVAFEFGRLISGEEFKI